MRLPTQLLRRKADSHKGDFGHTFILAGSLRYSGAALLCAEAALRSGAGLVTLGVPRGIAVAMIKAKPKEVMLYALPQTKGLQLSAEAFPEIAAFSRKADCIALGPGLDQADSTKRLVKAVVSRVRLPMVIDADALNALKGPGSIPDQAVITPHPGEFARLSGVAASAIQADRKKVAFDFARKHGCVLVLKGHHTLVVQGKKSYMNKTGNPGMSTAGSGDVLTGMIAAFIGQGLGLFEAAKYAVYLHGAAGDLAAKEKTEISLIASDIIGKIPQVIKGRR
jgi:hydroxyethylthiazole kinase-like uncharacterized protein yjeF